MFDSDFVLAVLLLMIEEFEMLSSDERLSSLDKLILEFKLLAVSDVSEYPGTDVTHNIRALQTPLQLVTVGSGWFKLSTQT